MRTKKTLNLGLILAVIITIILTGCQKEVDNGQPSPAKVQLNSGLKSAAAGSIVTTGTIVNGDYRTGMSLTASNSLTIKVTVTAIGTYDITTNTVNGYYFSKSGSFTTTGSQTITLPATGTPVAAGVSTFTVTFGNTTSFTAVAVSNLPIILSSCNTSYTYYEVANHKNQKVWLDRNLGASQAAVSANDYHAYGSLYQWGRLADNHQCITWASSMFGTSVNGVTSTTSATNTPANSLFVKTMASPWDWRVPQNNALWQGVSGINNPCPAGFRLPTSAEFTAEIATWTTKNTAGAFGSSLKWVMAGYRDFPDGQIYGPGTEGDYWSSTASSTKATIMMFSSSLAYTADDYRAAGFSVRCIKN
ncbi:MAG: FISUMP domain-containing protein [Bacteroidota bacterium]